MENSLTDGSLELKYGGILNFGILLPIPVANNAKYKVQNFSNPTLVIPDYIVWKFILFTFDFWQLIIRGIQQHFAKR